MSKYNLTPKEKLIKAVFGTLKPTREQVERMREKVYERKAASVTDEEFEKMAGMNKKDYNDELPLGYNANGWENQNDIETNADRHARRDEMLSVNPVIDANSFDDVENERLCQFCVYFSDRLDYRGKTEYFCEKRKDMVVNSGTRCFNNKFKRA